MDLIRYRLEQKPLALRQTKAGVPPEEIFFRKTAERIGDKKPHFIHMVEAPPQNRHPRISGLYHSTWITII